MASIIQIKQTGRWRALVRKKGFKSMCKTFARYDDAKLWADAAEKDIQPVPGDFLDDAVTVSMRPIVGIYFLTYCGRVIYVGQSKNVAQRVQSHSQRMVFDAYKYKECQVHELDSFEEYFIQKLRPQFNLAKVNSTPKLLPKI